MKKIGIIALYFSAFLIVSCSSTTNTSSSSNNNSAATQAGTNCGRVLAGLYTQYKSAGKVDLANSTTLLNVVELCTYCNALKDHKSDATYKTAFASGLVSGSNGLITNSNSLSILNSLLSLSGYNITSSTPSTSNEAINVALGLINLFKNLK